MASATCIGRGSRALVPAMAGAFIVLADGSQGFLPDSEGARGLTEGEPVGVRITRAPQGGKGARATARLGEAERAMLAEVPFRRGPGPLLELAAAHADAPIVADAPSLAARLRPLLGGRITLVRSAFDDALATEVHSLAEPGAELPGGLRAHITPTPALVAIDLDSAAATARGRNSRPTAPCCPAWRARSGCGTSRAPSSSTSPACRPSAARPSAPALPRRSPPTRCALACSASPRSASPRSCAPASARPCTRCSPARTPPASPRCAVPPRRVPRHPSWPPALRAAPAVAAALQADAGALAELAHGAGRPLMLRADPTLAPLGWVLED